jgi:hypothetical protein
MTASLRGCEFRSDVMRAAWTEGYARGLAKSIVKILGRRGVAVPDEVRDQVFRCTDLDQLENWLDSAATVGDIVRC